MPSDQVEPGYETRAQAAWDYLYAAPSKGELVDVTTPRRVYRSVLIESLREQRTPATGDALRAVATFRQLRVVEGQTVLVVTRKPGQQKLD